MDSCKDKDEISLFLADLAKFTKNALKTVECYQSTPGLIHKLI